MAEAGGSRSPMTEGPAGQGAPARAAAGPGNRRAGAAGLAAAAFAGWLVLTLVGVAAPGADLFPLYAAGRWIAEGLPHLIYVFDPAVRADISHPAWSDLAARVGYDNHLFAYIFPPLWAKLAAPAAEALPWSAFHVAGAALNAAALVAGVGVAARLWAPTGAGRKVFALSLLVAAAAWPALASAWFNQVHAWVMLCVLLALLLGEKDRPAAAGALLALAAAVKIAPALIGLYWLLSGRWNAAAWAVGCGAAMLALAAATGGLQLNLAFMEQLARLAAGAPTSTLNQSLTVWLARLFVDLETFIGAAPMPWQARALSAVAMVGLIAAALRRTPAGDDGARRCRLMPVVLIAAVAGGPIAWAYYFVFLIPLAFSLAWRVAGGGWIAAAAMAAMIANGLAFWHDRPLEAEFGPATLCVALLLAAACIWAPERDAAPAALRRPRARL
jgi:hypothetical protein